MIHAAALVAPAGQAAAAAAPTAAPADAEEEKVADAKAMLGNECTGTKVQYKDEILSA